MRYFWSLILVLAVVTAGLFTLRVSRERAALRPVASGAPAAGGLGEGGFGQRPARPAVDPSPAVVPASPDPAPPADAPEVSAGFAFEEEGLPAPSGEEQVRPSVSLAEDALVEVAAESAVPVEEAAPASQFSLDALLGVVAEVAERVEVLAETPVAVAAESAPPAAPVPDPMMEAALGANALEAGVAGSPTATAPGVVGPAFEVRADGSLSVEGVGVVPGSGTVQRPFVLDWEVLRSVQREFNPRQGRSEVPDWLKRLDGKRVRVEGNTLLPVVAQTADELLVMQNPWDGCCLGVPPTPYDAIEVKLANAQRMGNSPTSYGQVEGVFKVDPYIVSGWLLGLYLVEDAVFEAAAGIVLPEI